MSSWVRSSNDAGTFSLEALRKSDVILGAYSPKYNCPVLVARSKRGKERILGAWSDALSKGEKQVSDLLGLGVCVDVRSVGVWFS